MAAPRATRSSRRDSAPSASAIGAGPRARRSSGRHVDPDRPVVDPERPDDHRFFDVAISAASPAIVAPDEPEHRASARRRAVCVALARRWRLVDADLRQRGFAGDRFALSPSDPEHPLRRRRYFEAVTARRLVLRRRPLPHRRRGGRGGPERTVQPTPTTDIISAKTFTGRSISKILGDPAIPRDRVLLDRERHRRHGRQSVPAPRPGSRRLPRHHRSTAASASPSFTKLTVSSAASIAPDVSGNQVIADMIYDPTDATAT